MPYDSNKAKKILPVLLSGGSGTRLWPVSRKSYPKQFLALTSEKTLLQETASRLNREGFLPPLVIASEEHRFIIAEQLRLIDVHAQSIILEPFARNTAPAVAVAAVRAAKIDPDATLLVLPVDQVIQDNNAFLEKLHIAMEAAEQGNLVTFGVVPTKPETGYGYIKIGDSLDTVEGGYKVESFVEKPDLETAKRYIADEQHLWNAGIFLLPLPRLMEELKTFAPDSLAAADAALDQSHSDLSFCRLDPDSFGTAPNVSFDYAVMEKTQHAAVVPVDMGWNDVGSWFALWEHSDKDENGNVPIGNAIMVDSSNCYVRSEEMLTAVIGLDDVVVVTSDDAILVARSDRVQEVKQVVEQLKRDKRPEAIMHSRVYRPWGFYQGIHEGDRFQVKRISVNPGQKLSLQKHHHRAEHWVVVNGTAIVTKDEEEILLRENESVYIPLGSVHRLENPGKIPLTLIEVQSGAYLGEDDIVRLSDNYGRAEK